MSTFLNEINISKLFLNTGTLKEQKCNFFEDPGSWPRKWLSFPQLFAFVLGTNSLSHLFE